MGRHPLGALRAHRPPRDARAASRSCSTASASRLDPDRPVRGLSIADQQIVEIAKALASTRAC